jgi:threonine/homoserine/homoserine lactone efflux protein
MGFEESHILLAFITYFVATASPGPATLSIMDIAMKSGRKPALIFASGVLLGSFIWAFLALLGVAILLSTHANLLFWLKILGGTYLLWLAYKSAKRALIRNETMQGGATKANNKLFLQGLALHITNPKAIFTWVAIVSLALPQDASVIVSLTIVIGCMVLGAIVFGGYATMFSTSKAQKAYQRFGHWFSAILALAFGVAGFKLLSSQIKETYL